MLVAGRGGASWDEALVMARAMTACTRAGSGTTNENHWTERAAALLAPLLYAAHLTDRSIGEVLRWTLRQDLAPADAARSPTATAQIAADVLVGIEQTDARERSSDLLRDGRRARRLQRRRGQSAAEIPNFDPPASPPRRDTIYITAPEHKQALCAPLIVGLLEQIRHAVYERARDAGDATDRRCCGAWMRSRTSPRSTTCPPSSPRRAGRSLQVMIGLQDLSQARTRWGADAADGFISCSRPSWCSTGSPIARSLEAISLALGEYDRDTVNHSLGRSDPQEWFGTTTHSDTVGYQTQRQRVLTPGEIARLPRRARTTTAGSRLAAARAHALAPKRAMEDDRRGTRVMSAARAAGLEPNFAGARR